MIKQPAGCSCTNENSFTLTQKMFEQLWRVGQAAYWPVHLKAKSLKSTSIDISGLQTKPQLYTIRVKFACAQQAKQIV